MFVTHTFGSTGEALSASFNGLAFAFLPRGFFGSAKLTACLGPAPCRALGITYSGIMIETEDLKEFHSFEPVFLYSAPNLTIDSQPSPVVIGSCVPLS